ncbi:MAG: amidohydrolase [Desulfarculaceae bacterium]|nr:amidohydrolase [Desulfarculaceae bacterium]MCF8073729.1 amidohydrolase [Desulfarculaceae bacterium]MCF8101970.1 amidohydrolase [Desulfarculaceae bacterium]MCF8115940.1 amidohydrolase [Desulfarculaceae bacterium]
MELSPDTRDWLSQVRRELHQDPELSLKEERTTGRILDLLYEMGVEAHGLEGMTGAVGLIPGNAEGPCLAIRADIDALPISEQGEAPYKSQNPGVMHACGHDAHTAILLGVAREVVSSGLAAKMKGSLKLLFQPAEEIGQGARMMVERGVMDQPKVDRVLAAHVAPKRPAGQVGFTVGQSHASNDIFSLRISGKGAHGARPQEGVDPIVASANLVAALQSVVARNLNPLEAGVITVGRLAAGSASNVIPDHAELEGCIRAMNRPAQELLQRRLRELVEGNAAAFGVTSELDIREVFPACHNDPEVAAFMQAAAEAVVGPENVYQASPVTGSEDFAFFSAAAPGAMIRLGCSPAGDDTPLHASSFDLDEKVLAVGVAVFVQAVASYLG